MELTNLKGLTADQWGDLAQRVGRGLAVDRDADLVQSIGLLDQANRIRHGMATHQDAILINLQANLRLMGLEEDDQQVAA